MESIAVTNVVYTGNSELFKVHTRLRYNSTFYYLPVDVYKLYKHVKWRVYRRWRVQQSTTLCTLVATEYFKHIRDWVYNSIFYYLPADVYKLYNIRIYVRWRVHRRWKIHSRRRVHRRWRVQQLITLCILATTEYLKYIRGCLYNSIFYCLPADV